MTKASGADVWIIVAVLVLFTVIVFMMRRQSAAPFGFHSCKGELLVPQGSGRGTMHRYGFSVDGEQFVLEDERHVLHSVVHYNPHAPGDAPVLVYSLRGFYWMLAFSWLLVLSRPIL